MASIWRLVIYICALQKRSSGDENVAYVPGSHSWSPIFNLFLYLILTSVYSTAAYAGHVATKQADNTVYILYSAPNRLARFDLASGSALEDISLGKVPTALAVSAGTAYVGFNRELIAIDLATGAQEFVRNFSSSIVNIEVVNSFIFVQEHESYQYHVIDAQTFARANLMEVFRRGQNLLSSNELNAIFLQRRDGELTKIVLNDQCMADTIIDIPHGRNFDPASQLYINASQTKLVQNNDIGPGDGIPNETEALYDFLDPFNPFDAGIDYDNDGVSNLFEINNGTDPEIADEFPYIDLAQYLPLTEGEYAYVNELHFVTREIRKLATRDETVVIIANRWSERFEKRSDGIYLASRSDPASLDATKYENFLYLPNQLKLGQKITSIVTPTPTSAWSSSADFEVSLQLIARGHVAIEGKTYPSLTIRYSYFYPQDFFIPQEPIGYSEDITFAEDIGWFQLGDLALDSFAFKQNPSVPVETPDDSSDDDADTGNGRNGGGSFPLSSMLLVLLIAAQRASRTQKTLTRKAA